MGLLDIMACPACRGDVQQEDDRKLVCVSCGRGFDVAEGVPLTLPDHGAASFVHEHELLVHEGYVPQVQAIMDSLNPDHVVLDLGAGNRSIDSKHIVRMDAVWSPMVDIVGDAHGLPFKADVFDLVYSSAVFEHLRQPFDAASEILRVLRPGGTVIADCNFVYPFHGFPCVYFNASAQGMRELFADFTVIDVMVAPWQEPSYALEALVAEYVRMFKPQTEREKRWLEALEALDGFPIHDFDQRFSREDAARIAAGTTLVGVKPTSGGGSWVPPLLESIWRQDADLSSRFPVPSALVASFDSDAPQSLLIWARAEGRERHPELAAWLDDRPVFDKGLGRRPLGPAGRLAAES